MSEIHNKKQNYEDRKMIIGAVVKAKEEVESIQEDVKSYKDEVEKIKALAGQLKQIEEALIPKRKWFISRIGSLQSIITELSEMHTDMTLDNIDGVFKLIGHNLVDGMVLVDIEEDNYKKKIIFEYQVVGYIQVIKNENIQVQVNVTVKDKKDSFMLTKPDRIYSIVSFINTAFNYQQL